MLCFQEYGEWKKGAADLSLPTVPVSCMDGLASYVEAVTAATRELRDLILSSYQEKTSPTWKHVECRSSRLTEIIIREKRSNG